MSLYLCFLLFSAVQRYLCSKQVTLACFNYDFIVAVTKIHPV